MNKDMKDEAKRNIRLMIFYIAMAVLIVIGLKIMFMSGEFLSRIVSGLVRTAVEMIL